MPAKLRMQDSEPRAQRDSFFSRFIKQPLHDGLSYLHRKIRTPLGAVARGTAFVAAMGAASVDCTDQKEKPADEQVEETVTKQAQVTDQNGSALFTVNSKEYELIAIDAETGATIQNLIVLLVMNGDKGVYILIDSKDRYTAEIIGVENGIPDNSRGLRLADHRENAVETNVILRRTDNACNFLTSALTQNKSPKELFELSKRAAFFKDAGFGDSPVADNVPLRNLDNVLKQTIEFAAGYGAGTGIEKGIVHVAAKLGFDIATKTNPVGYILLGLDACDILEQREWAKYYRSLCYQDDDLFEVWKLQKWNGVSQYVKEFDITVGIVSNPLFVVLPKSTTPARTNWTVPTATIKGKQIIPGEDPDDITNFFVPTKPMELTHVGNMFPRLRFEVGRSGKFEFVVSACGNIDPAYELGVIQDLLRVTPKTTITVKQNKNDPTEPYTYEADFDDPQNMGCEHKTFYHDNDGDRRGTEFKRIVSCNQPTQYVELGGDCNDEDPQINPGVLEQCDGKDNNCNGRIDEFCTSNCEKIYEPMRTRDVSFGVAGFYKSIILLRAVGGSIVYPVSYLDLETNELVRIPFSSTTGYFADDSSRFVFDNLIAYAECTGSSAGTYPLCRAFLYNTKTKTSRLVGNGTPVAFSEGKLFIKKEGRDPIMETGCPREATSFSINYHSCIQMVDITSGSSSFITPYTTGVFYYPWIAKAILSNPPWDYSNILVRSVDDPTWITLVQNALIDWSFVLNKNRIVYSKQLQNPGPFHLFSVDINSRLEQQITGESLSDLLVRKEAQYYVGGFVVYGDNVAFTVNSFYNGGHIADQVFLWNGSSLKEVYKSLYPSPNIGRVLLYEQQVLVEVGNPKAFILCK